MEEYRPEQEEEEMQNGQPAPPEVLHAEDSTASKTTAMFPLFGNAHCKTSSRWVLAVKFGDSEEDLVDDGGVDTQI